jgi:hypothetical protein
LNIEHFIKSADVQFTHSTPWSSSPATISLISIRLMLHFLFVISLSLSLSLYIYIYSTTVIHYTGRSSSYKIIEPIIFPKPDNQKTDNEFTKFCTVLGKQILNIIRPINNLELERCWLLLWGGIVQSVPCNCDQFLFVVLPI